MNTKQSDYKKHIKDVYGIKNAVIPNVDQKELEELTENLRENKNTQLILLRYWREIQLNRYRANGNNAEPRVWEDGRLINLEQEVNSLTRLCKGIDEKVIPPARELAEYIQLGSIKLEENGKVKADELSKLLKTARWLIRNCEYIEQKA